mgnify:CR=1 FL=1
MKETDKNKNIDKKEAKKAKKARKRGRAGRRIAQVLMCFLLTVAFVASAAGGAVAAYYKAATNTITTDTKTALKNADVVDADLEYDPMEYPQIVSPIFNDEADVVYGSRFKESRMKGYLANRMANWFLTRLSNLFTHLKCTDMETCYKAFKREIIQSVDIQEKRFGFEPEITAKVAKMNVRFKEVPISYYPRTNEEGKKIGFSDGVRAIYCIWRYRK